MRKTLSIVVPTYRRPGTLERALASVAAATRADHEIIVVDDCPEGSAFELARRFGARYLFKAGRQRGLSASRNLGLDVATGVFVAFLDDDDFFNPSGLDALLQHASAHEGLCFGNFSTFTHEQRVHHDLAALTADHLLVCNQIPVGAYVMRRAGLSSRFDERLRSHEDWEFLLRQLAGQSLRRRGEHRQDGQHHHLDAGPPPPAVLARLPVDLRPLPGRPPERAARRDDAKPRAATARGHVAFRR
jgi:glycosyltransferase involved in cell wall biosynthesis